MGLAMEVEMANRGNVVHKAGDYKVYEVVDTYLNNKTEVQGYHVVGPKSDPTWLHTLDSAVKEADELADKR
ncbi:hypothetical protein D3C76_559990 [compost metagenome]